MFEVNDFPSGGPCDRSLQGVFTTEVSCCFTRPWVASNVQVTYSAPVSSKLSTAWQLTEELLAEEVRRKIQLGFSEKKIEGDGGYPP